MEHTRKFDQEITELNGMISDMATSVKALIKKSIVALKEADRTAAQVVVEDDQRVDQMELEIDEKCIQLIALRQPEASDLRFLITGVSISTDLERIGDLAGDIAQRTQELTSKPDLAPFAALPQMAELAEEELSIVLDAFISRDAGKARQVWVKEQAVDRLRNMACQEFLDMMTKDGTLVPKAMPLLLAARHLERISDHITNIAEDIIYMVEGKVVKHSGIKHEMR